MRFVSALPKNEVSNMLSYQLLKRGTSIAANYCEASRAESRGDQACSGDQGGEPKGAGEQRRKEEEVIADCGVGIADWYINNE